MRLISINLKGNWFQIVKRMLGLRFLYIGSDDRLGQLSEWMTHRGDRANHRSSWDCYLTI